MTTFFKEGGKDKWQHFPTWDLCGEFCRGERPAEGTNYWTESAGVIWSVGGVLGVPWKTDATSGTSQDLQAKHSIRDQVIILMCESASKCVNDNLVKKASCERAPLQHLEGLISER